MNWCCSPLHLEDVARLVQRCSSSEKQARVTRLLKSVTAKHISLHMDAAAASLGISRLKQWQVASPPPSTTPVPPPLKALQRDVVCAWAAGRDVFVLSGTGTGKSICFQLPSLLAPSPSVVIVVSPLISLMRDQCVHMQRRCLICFGLSRNLQ